jgi:hypothetical protein
MVQYQIFVEQLRQGIRLPYPPFCPDKIWNLMRSCFHETPEERPDFKEIQETIQSATNSLFQSVTSVNGASNINDIQVSYTTGMPFEMTRRNRMKERYYKVQNANQGQDHDKSKKNNESKTEDALNYASSTNGISLENEKDDYALLRKTSPTQLQHTQEEESPKELSYVTIEHVNSTSPIENDHERALDSAKSFREDQEVAFSPLEDTPMIPKR